MSSRDGAGGGAPGGGSPVVARGKIKVDARKAIAKLRDHLLVDLHLYATEIARVAVALGATTLAVEWDADDVVLTFDGRPLPAASAARARDHVLTPEGGGTDGDALRVLGIGLSAALGLGPAFVDVYSADALGCARLRFHTKHLDEDASAEAPDPVAVTLPSGMIQPGMRVHVRRRVGMEILSRALRRDVPREVGLLLAALRDSPLTVTVNGEPAERGRASTVLVRVDLDEPSATRAVLELLVPARGFRPRTQFLDLGVHLVENEGAFVGALDTEDLAARVVVDARRLPTNASRSEVRMDADLVTRIRARVPAALAAALVVLEAIVVAGAAPARGPIVLKSGHTVEVAEVPRHLLEEALGAIAAQVAMAMRAGRVVTPEERHLLTLPLLLDAVGRPMSLASLRGGTAEHPLLVYTGQAPAPIELATWLSGIVWQRGRAVEQALASLMQVSADERVAQAREGHVRRQRALAHPASRAALPASTTYLLKDAFAVREGPYAGLDGEVAVMRREGGYRRTSTARLFVDERLLETVQLPGVALPVDMAISWKGRIEPRLAYDAVERTDHVSRAVVYALRVAALAVGERLGPSDPELGRLAIVACASATETLGDAKPPRAALGKLALQAVWPTTDGRLVTLAELEAFVTRTGALCFGPAGGGAAVDGRLVVVAEHGRVLSALFGPKAALIDYGVFLGLAKSAIEEGLRQHGWESPFTVPIARKNVVGVVGIGPNRKRILHGGKLLSDEPFAYRNGPVCVVLDDRAAVPTADHKGVLWTSSETGETQREEDALLELVVDACERGDLALDVVDDYLTATRRALLVRQKQSHGAVEQARWATALAERIVALPARVAQSRRDRAKAVVMARGRTARASAIASAGAENAPSATVTTPSGSVTAMFLRNVPKDAGPLGEVMFDGYHIESTTLFAAKALILANVVREGLLDDWATLTNEGRQWARDTAGEAVLKLLAELARGDGFTSDGDALRLAESMADRGPAFADRVARVLRGASWPTVQGTATQLPRSGPVAFGLEAYAPYRTSKEVSPYDAPAAHLPDTQLGRLRGAVLARAGFELIDVSAPIARLQELRSHQEQAATPPPCLPGAPAHTMLRVSLEKLGVTLAEGELELVAGDLVEVTRVDGRGATHPVSLSVPLQVPVRAIFRANGEAGAERAAELDAACVRHLRSLGRHLEVLPPFVRERMRALVCSDVARGVRSPAEEALPLFTSREAALWSLSQLVALGTVRRTRDNVFWTVPNPNAPIVIMSDAEARSLASVLRLQDCTEELREAQRGHERRTAPPLTELKLSADLRAQCMHTFIIDEPGLRGEVGLLRPAHAARRGIFVHTTMRPVATVQDGGAWPTAAVVDVDDLVTTRGFDGLATPADVTRLQHTIRAAVASRAVAILPAPPDALGVLRTPAPFMARMKDGDSPGAASRPVACLGVFWLTPEWPEAPTVYLETENAVDPFRRPRIAQTPGAHHRVLPIAGRVWICGTEGRVDEALELVMRFVLERIAPRLASATTAMKASSPEERAAYEWDLRLLGARGDANPVAELAKDRPDPILVRVATRRAPQLIDAAIAATAARAARTAPSPPGRVAAPPPPQVEAASTPNGPAAPTAPAATTAPAAPTAPTAEPAPSASLFQGLARWVVDLVTPAPEPVSESALTESLHRALSAMKLSGEPVARVVESKRGRPVRYEAKTKRLVVNTTHESIASLSSHPSRVVLLLLAAVSEINRDLVEVTDAEEMTVIVDMLRDG